MTLPRLAAVFHLLPKPHVLSEWRISGAAALRRLRYRPERHYMRGGTARAAITGV